MCGIAGIYHHTTQRPVDPAVAESMAEALRHRGPDDSGFFVEGPLAIAMRRLSIIDLDGGHQPMGNEDGSVLVVCNGEIYNYRALRAELESLGHHFRSRSDTEVLVHGYEEFGAGVLGRLNGMFGIALWDRRARRLLLARDRLGIKPLYFSRTPDGLAFASELKSLLQYPGIDRTLDRVALRQYLAWNYIPSPRTPFSSVHKLPPATMLFVEGDSVRSEVYWRLKDERRPMSLPEAEEGLRAHLDRSVRLQMEADVPVGAFLSGGLDSSALVAALCTARRTPVHTFSIGFGEVGFDESSHARQVASHLGTIHREEVLRPDCLGLIDEIAGFLDEPFADDSILPTYLVSRLARQDVKVVLSGDGGDELFAGYDHYKAERLMNLYARVPGSARRAALGLFGRGVERSPTKRGSVGRGLQRLEDALACPSFLAQARFMLHGGPSQSDGLLLDAASIHPEDAWAEPFAAVVDDSPYKTGLAHQQFIDLRTYLADDILFKTDRASMAASLEARVPYLDHELVEFAFRIPAQYKLRGLVGKWILRRVHRGLLPERILRRRKSGFSIPVATWLRGDLRSLSHDLLAPARLQRQGLFRPDAVGRLLREHGTLTANHGRVLWALMMFQLWAERFLAASWHPSDLPVATGSHARR